MTRAWKKEKNQSPCKESNPGALSTEPRELKDSQLIELSLYLTGVLHFIKPLRISRIVSD